jgi:hypothetical protein
MFRNSRRIKLDLVVMQDWMNFHRGKSSADAYYLRLCNRVLKCILASSRGELKSEETPIEMACMFVAYFEDVVSETHIFRGFTGQHRKLYGSYLPFYDTSKEYWPEEVNLCDLYFLAWHYFSTVLRDEIGHGMINPFMQEAPGFRKALGEIYAIFEEAYEDAPVNETLQKTFRLPGTATQVEIRAAMDFLACRSYLNALMFDMTLEKYMKELRERLKETATPGQNIQDQVNMHLYDFCTEYIFNHCAPLLGLRPPQELAGILGETHPLHGMLNRIGQRMTGTFRFVDMRDEGIIFEHIPSGTPLHLEKERFTALNVSFEPRRTCMVMSIVQWDDQWLQLGMALRHESDESIGEEPTGADIFKDPKQETMLRGLLEKAFMKVNGGKRVVFAEGKAAFDRLRHEWEKAFRQLVARRANAAELRRQGEEFIAVSFPDTCELTKPITLFLNPNGGPEYYFNITACITDDDNPYRDNGQQFELEIAVSDEKASREFVTYLLESKCVHFIESKDSDIELSLILRHLDFLMRYYKRDLYWKAPQIIHRQSPDPKT